MSLYNIVVNGTNPLAPVLLAMLGLKPASAGRFRDCYVQRAPTGELEVHLYTRNGGGNRPDYVDVTAALQAHPMYLRDFDDSFDATYAAYVFRYPDGESRAALEALVADCPELIPKPPGERFAALLAKMKDDPNDPEVQRVQAALAPTLEQITKHFEKPT